MKLTPCSILTILDANTCFTDLAHNYVKKVIRPNTQPLVTNQYLKNNQQIRLYLQNYHIRSIGDLSLLLHSRAVLDTQLQQQIAKTLGVV